MAKKPGITLERHEEIGEQLRTVKQFLTNLQCEIGNAYPVSGEGGRAYTLSIKAKHYIEQLCSRLEDEMFSQHETTIKAMPNPSHPLNFYYGPQKKDVVFKCDA